MSYDNFRVRGDVISFKFDSMILNINFW